MASTTNILFNSYINFLSCFSPHSNPRASYFLNVNQYTKHSLKVINTKPRFLTHHSTICSYTCMPVEPFPGKTGPGLIHTLVTFGLDYLGNRLVCRKRGWQTTISDWASKTTCQNCWFLFDSKSETPLLAFNITWQEQL